MNQPIHSTPSGRYGRSRRQGRVLALQMMYAFDQKHLFHDGCMLVEEEIARDILPEAKEFALRLYDGFRREHETIDRVIAERLHNWTVPRLAVVDRCIIRLGCFELIYCADTPPKVAINEYIEMSKIYGSESRTTKLVNGVLDRIARDHRPDEVDPREPSEP